MTFKHPPLAHQAEELVVSRDAPYRGLFWEMGTGKSKVMVDTMAWLYKTGQIDVAVIVAKKGEYTNWKYNEIPEHMPADVPYQCEVYRSGLRAAEKRAIKNLADPSAGDRLRILCINVESLAMDKRKRMSTEGAKVAAGFMKTRRVGAFMVVDESTCIKNYKAMRAKTVVELGRRAGFRRVLSGTPITRSPLDMWGQALFLSPRALRFGTFTEFRAEYAVIEKQFRGAGGKDSFPTIAGYQNLDKLNRVICEFSSIKERRDCVDLPPKIYKKTAVPLTDKQAELYRQMRDEAIAELGDGTIVEAVNALGIIARLDQIACGQIKRPDGTFEIVESNRPDALVASIEQSEKRQIVWCSYRGLNEHLFDRLRDEFGTKAVGRYYGGVPDDERERVVASFQDPDAEIRYILANQSSMGYGRTLTMGKVNHYFCNGYNLEHRLQSEDRTMRIGQDEPVLYNDLYTPYSINEKIYANLREKKSLAQQVLGTRITDWI
jgi:SNF2 family DNA or RNA helicase